MWWTISADLRANVDASRHSGLRYWAMVCGKALVAPQVQAVLLFRLSSRLAPTWLRPIAFAIRALVLAMSGAEIHPDARIGPGFALLHSSGVVIGGGVRIGRDCRMSQGVTLGEQGRGGRRSTWGWPVVGDHVTLGAHCVALGPRHIGSWSVVGANSVVTHDLPEASVAVGSPARVVRTLDMADFIGRGDSADSAR